MRNRVIVLFGTLAVSAAIVFVRTPVKYFLVGLPIFSIPAETFNYHPDRFINGAKLPVSATQRDAIMLWLHKNRHGWYSDLAWVPDGVVIIIGPTVFNFHLNTSTVFASFAVNSEGDRVQLYRRLSREESENLSRAGIESATTGGLGP